MCVGNKVKQRIIRHVGNALNDEELKHLKNLAEYIKALIQSEIQPTIFPPMKMAKWAIEAHEKSNYESLNVFYET